MNELVNVYAEKGYKIALLSEKGEIMAYVELPTAVKGDSFNINFPVVDGRIVIAQYKNQGEENGKANA